VPYTITSPGVYCVAEPLTAVGNAPVITINNIFTGGVTLDLNGETITGSSTADCILSHFSVGAIIKNGFIRQGNIGIHVRSSKGIRIQNIKKPEETAGNTMTKGVVITNFPAFAQSDEIVVENCQLRTVSSVGYEVGEAQGVVFRNCLVNNVTTGFNIIGIGSNAVIENCQVMNATSGYSISVLWSDICFRDCTAMNISGNGFLLNSSRSVMSSCKVFNCGLNGFQISGPQGIAKDCMALGIGNIGFSLTNTNGCVINAKAVNCFHGFFANATGNSFVLGIAKNCSGVGFGTLFFGAPFNIFRYCQAITCDRGFEMNSDFNILRDCVAANSTTLGINIAAPFTENEIIGCSVVGTSAGTGNGIAAGAGNRLFNNIVHNCTTNYPGAAPAATQKTATPDTTTGYWANLDL
jgi:hypothetical protein